MATVLAPLLAAGGPLLYVAASTRLVLWRRVPWEFLGLSAAGVLLGVWRLTRTPGLGSAVAALLATALFAFFCWWIFSGSMYGAREDRPRVGDRFPDFTLPASSGPPFSLAAARGRRLLVLFYRGAW